MRKKSNRCAYCLPIKRCVFQFKTIKKEETFRARAILAKLQTSANSWSDLDQPCTKTSLDNKGIANSGKLNAIFKSFESHTMH